MNFQYNDGGRAKAGYKGVTGDCVVRAIAIATGQSYQKVYDDISEYDKKKKYIARTGVPMEVSKNYLKKLGFKWIPTMTIGSGCKVHMKADELPKGRIIVRVTKHMTAVIDGVIHDTYDCSREETRCVYGYFIKEN